MLSEHFLRDMYVSTLQFFTCKVQSRLYQMNKNVILYNNLSSYVFKCQSDLSKQIAI